MGAALVADDSYHKWIVDVSKRFRSSQIKAALRVNAEMLRFYWSLGKDLSLMNDESRYGSAFFQTVSRDLSKELPDIHAFSVTNLKYMKYFFEMYPDAGNRQQLADESESNSSGQNRPRLGDELTDDCIFFVPWGHQIAILGRCRGDSQKALFYVRKTLENNWSRAVLMGFLDSGLYERQGKAATNFSVTLPETQSDLAQAITKDPYSFDFLTMRERYDEKELKDALMANAEQFFRELGSGFAFLGREVRIEVGSTEKFIDLLFYHVKQHCYVVVEVKATNFDSSYAGQLGTYVVAVNHQMKTEGDASTIGILICKGMDKVEAQYALESSSQPLGLSSYQLSKLVPEDFKSSLPSIEEIEAGLDNPEIK